MFNISRNGKNSQNSEKWLCKTLTRIPALSVFSITRRDRLAGQKNHWFFAHEPTRENSSVFLLVDTEVFMPKCGQAYQNLFCL